MPSSPQGGYADQATHDGEAELLPLTNRAYADKATHDGDAEHTLLHSAGWPEPAPDLIRGWGRSIMIKCKLF